MGRMVAKRLKRPFMDVDETIEKKEGRRISDIFQKEGEVHFRALEKKAIRDLAGKRGLVFATGGGAILDPGNRKLLKKIGFVIALLAKPGTIFKRVQRSRRRPLLEGKDKLLEIKRLLKIRGPYYRQADMCVETDGCTARQAARRVLQRLMESGEWNKTTG
ncbi:MAG: shikimate kinase [Candidatus Omnitrophica bacterium]|nr:shikimate kinase [Candidatus Omnitrophota bacterium]